LSLFLAVVAFSSPPLDDFELPSVADEIIRHSEQAGGRPAVIAFLTVDCPMASVYAARLNDLLRRFPPGSFSLVAVDSNPNDSYDSMESFMRRRALGFPFLRDADGAVAEMCQAKRTPFVVLLDKNRQVRYRGRIDDQYSRGGANRGAPTREDLHQALQEVLAGKSVAVPETEATGCVLERAAPRPAADPVPARDPPPPPARYVYSRDIAPIIERHCRSCHRPGEVAPFPLLNYRDAKSHAGTIAEVVASGAMPPWHASPHYGTFRNARGLTDAEKQVIAEWVRTGAQEGDPAPAVDDAPAPKWRIGRPDAVFGPRRSFDVPAEGVIPYQHFIVDTGYTTDVWVSAVEVRPSNRRVVHHCSVFLQPASSARPDEYFETGALGSFFLGSFTPGTGAVEFPPGMAKRIPAGTRLHFAIHYTPIGTPEVDRTTVGLRLADPRTIRKEVATKVLLAEDIAIPPHAADYRVERTWTAPADMLLLSMFPHMHVRGKSICYQAEYPDGRNEILLDVPHYDFNWQHLYELAAPVRLPAGTIVRATAAYDNSAANPHNPNPSATVRTGLQSWDEMFNMYFDVALADEDLIAAAQTQAARRLWLAVAALAVTSAFLVRAFHRRWTRNR